VICRECVLARENDEFGTCWCSLDETDEADTYLYEAGWPDRDCVRDAERKAKLEEQLGDSIRALVARVNARAEAEMLKTGNIAGAHHRAIEAELKELTEG